MGSRGEIPRQLNHKSHYLVMINPANILPTSQSTVNFPSSPFIFLPASQTSFFGSNQNDWIISFGDNKIIRLGNGNNRLFSNGDHVQAYSGTGNDMFSMTGGNQSIFSEGGRNFVKTSAGDDRIILSTVSSGDDRVESKAGNDI